jgi:hypothetical protein
MRTLEDTLVEELSAEPDPEFVADMERRMQLGFPPRRKPRFAAAKARVPKRALRVPRPGWARRARPGWASRLRPPAAAGATAGVMLALLVTVALVDGGAERPRPDGPVAVDVQPEQPAVGPTAEKSRDHGGVAMGAGASEDHGGLAASAGGSGDGGGAARDGGGVETQERLRAPDGQRRANTMKDGRDVVTLESLMPGGTLPAPVPPDGVVAPQPRRGVAPGRRDRVVERSAQLSLAADPGEFDRVADSVFRVAGRRGGFVLRSAFTEDERGGSSGFFELRVPAAQLQRTLDELSRVATVRARTESGNDITGRFVSARDRLRIARAERESLLLRLEQATTGAAAAALRRRLEIVAAEITAVRQQLRRIRDRTQYAAVTVDLIDENAGPKAAAGKTGRAVDDAVESLEDIGAFLIRALGILVPLALAGALGWFAAARARRRARERALA